MLALMNLDISRSRITGLVVLAAFALGGVSALGQGGGQRPGGGPPQPLLIDFTAVGADGKTVEGLAPADVTIKIGGKARTISSLELKKVASGAAPAAAAAGAPAAAAGAGDVTPPFFTNEAKAAPAPAAASAATARNILIVIDTDSLTAASETQFKAAVNALLDGLAPGDRVALSTAPRDTANVGLGTPIARVKEALNAVRAQRPASVSNGDALCRTSQTLKLLNQLIQPLAANSSPSSVVFIASGLSQKGRDTGSQGSCEVVDDDYKSVVDATAEARANIYVVQGDQAVMGRNDGLEQLAGVAGAGAVMRVTGDGIAPRILSESGSFWVATVAPDPSDRVGQAQRLEVATAKAGVTVHARQMAAPSRMAMAGPGAAAAPKGPAAPKDMISSPAQFNDLQLRGSAVVQRGKGEMMTIIVQAEPVDPTVTISAMKVGYFDANNKGGSVDPPQIKSFPITTPIGVPTAGQYRIRVAAQDSTGKSGAVDIPVNATLAAAGPLKLSNLLIGSKQGDAGMKPQMTFKDEKEVLVFFELYGQLTAGISAKFELAKSDTGPAMETFQPAGGGPTNEPDKLQVFGSIPIEKLEPGDYVIRVLVQMEGQPEGKVLKTFRKVK